MSVYLTDEHVNLLNLILFMSRKNAQGMEFVLSDKERIVETELSAYGNSNILIKFKIKVIQSDKKGIITEEIIKEQKCALTENNLSEGKIGFSIENSEHSKVVLQIIQLLIEKLEVIKANSKEK